MQNFQLKTIFKRCKHTFLILSLIQDHALLKHCWKHYLALLIDRKQLSLQKHALLRIRKAVACYFVCVWSKQCKKAFYSKSNTCSLDDMELIQTRKCASHFAYILTHTNNLTNNLCTLFLRMHKHSSAKILTHLLQNFFSTANNSFHLLCISQAINFETWLIYFLHLLAFKMHHLTCRWKFKHESKAKRLLFTSKTYVGQTTKSR